MPQLFKNVASQKLRVFAFADAGHASLDAGEPVTGDAANISAQTAVDNAALGASNDVAPTEVDATNAPGYYEFDLTQAETNGSVIEFYPKSSTAGVQVKTVGGDVQTILPANHPVMGIESDGHVHGDLKEWIGVAPLALANQRPQVEVDAYDASLDFNSTQKASINAEADTALSDYDPPTNAEMEARTLAAASYFDPATDKVFLGDGAHGGSAATMQLKTLVLTDANSPPLQIAATGSAWAVDVTAGSNDAVRLTNVGVGTYSVKCTSVGGTEGTNGEVASVSGGINTAAGTITTLDGLDTAQDSQHSATQSELAKVPKSDSNVTWNATAAAQIQSEANDALTAFWTSPATLVDLVWDEVITGAAHNVNTSAARFLREAAQGIGTVGTAQGGTATTITLESGGVATDDILNGERIQIIGGTGIGQSRLIIDSVASSDVCTVDRNWITDPDNTSIYSIQGADADLRAIEGNADAADNFLADYDGTGYNKANSTIGTCTTNTDMRGTDSAYTGTPPTAIQNADATLKRAISNVEADADKHSLALLVAIATNSSLSGSTLTASKPSDDSLWFSYTVTSDSGADPVTGVS